MWDVLTLYDRQTFPIALPLISHFEDITDPETHHPSVMWAPHDRHGAMRQLAYGPMYLQDTIYGQLTTS